MITNYVIAIVIVLVFGCGITVGYLASLANYIKIVPRKDKEEENETRDNY